MVLKSVKNPVWSYPEEEIWQTTMDMASQCRVLHRLARIVLVQVRNPAIYKFREEIDAETT